MLKKLFLSPALMAGLIAPSHSAGTIQFSLSQQFDPLGKPLANCFFYTIQAGTTSTPQSAFQDSALTLPLPNPMRCDAAGRLPQFYLADGLIKVRITDKSGVSQNYPNGSGAIDNIQVIGPSGGGGGGGTVDPTTILQTGDIKAVYGTGNIVGFVRLNGKTMGSASSGATERANADTQGLFQYLWSADPNLTVSTGRGASASADWAANKQITLPDARGRTLAALDDMGNTAAGRLTATYFGTAATVLGAAGGSQSHTQTIAEMASHGHSITDPGHFHVTTTTMQQNPNVAAQGLVGGQVSGSLINMTSASATTGITVNANGSGTAFTVVNPMMLVTYYAKL